ncbi:hypothetical protein GW17_00040153 [Ensete ventricosum]|nr:hypothetical protein GW17_00040153 [Ensete ventricosum]
MSPHACSSQNSAFTCLPLSDVSSDLTVEVGTSSFALHKFPLVSRSGRIRKLISEAKNSKVTRINLHGTPGGAEAFEIAAKFCYGINTELNPSNVAMLRCAAHYLEMTEEFAEKNLELRTEIYLKEAVIPNIVNSITVLHHCESLLPAAEEINLINRILTAVATTVCKEQLTSGLSKLDHSLPHKPAMAGVEPPKDWWGKSLAVLSLDFFQRALSAMKSKGLKQETVSKILINYAQSSLQGLMVRDMQSSKGGFSDADMLKQQKIVVETIVSLLPSQSRKSPVHPNIKDSERYRLCKTIDCQKLSQEACSHAAQNERLPIQMAVQVLYLEQIRLRNVINGGHDQFFFGSAMGQCAQRSGSGVGSGAISPRDNYASVRRENRELKLEVARMRIRLTDLEKDHVSMKQELVRANPANKLLRSFTKNLSKLSALFRMRVDVKPLSAKAASDARLLFQKRRRQAIW